MEPQDYKNKIDIPLTSAIIVIIVSFSVIIGWLFGIDFLKNSGLHYIPMSSASALCFILLSFSVISLIKKKFVQTSKIFSLLVLFFNLIIFFKIIFKIDTNFENLFRSPELTENSLFYGRVAGITALNFICLGFVLLLYNTSRFRNKIFPVAFFPLILSAFVISGYIYDVSSLYSFGLFSSMALNSALLFLILSFGIVFLFEDSFIVKIVTEKSTARILLRRVLPSILLLLVIIKLLTVLGSSLGLYSHEFSEALEIVAFCISISLVILWNAKILYKYDTRLKRTHDEVSLLFEAGIKLGNSLDLNIIYDNIFSTIKDVMECDDFVISTYSREDNLIRCNYLNHQGKLLNAESLPPLPLSSENLGTQSDVIKTGKSLLISDFENIIKKTKKRYFIDDEGKVRSNIINDEELDKSALMVPIRINNEVAGVIQVLSSNKNAYSPYHLKFLEAFSPQIAAAIANANLYKQAQKEIEERIKIERTLQLTQFSVDKSADAITWVDMNGKFTKVNDSACKLFLSTKENLLNLYVWDFDIKASKRTWFDFKGKLKEAGIDLSESVIRNGKNELISVEILANYIVFEGQEYIVAFVRDITARKKAQVELINSENKYKHLFASIPLPVIIFDDESFEILNVNGFASSAYGYSYEEFLKLKMTDIRPKEDIENFKELIKNRKPGEVYMGNSRHCRKNGSLMFVEITSYGLIYEGRNAHVALVKDVTVDKKAEMALKDSENKYRQLFENIPIPVYIADADTLKILSINQAFINVYGYSNDECTKLSLLDLRPPEEIERFVNDVKKDYSNDRGEWLHRKKDGTIINVEITRYSILYGGREAYVSLINDVTEKKRAQQEILKSKEQLQNIFDNLDNVIWSLDLANKKVLQVSPACLKVFGRTQEEFFNNPFLWMEIVYPEDKQKVKLFNPSFFEKQSYVDQFRIVHKNGEVRWVEHNINCTRDRNDNLVRLDGITTDITERIKAEEALKQSEERFKQVAENAGEWIWEVDSKGLYTYASPIVEKILGYGVDEIVGKKYFYDFFQPETKEEMKKGAFEAFSKKLPFKNFLNVNVHKSGRLVVLETNGAPIEDQNGNLLGYRGADTDVTERMKMEEQLKMTQYSVENASDAVIWIDKEGNFVNVNDAVCKLVNLDRETLLNLSVRDFYKAYTYESWIEYWNLLKNKKSYNSEYKIEIKDKIIQIDILGNYIKYGDKEYLVIFGRDVTQRKETEQALIDSEDNFRTIFENNSAAMLVIERDTTISMVNNMFCETTGFTKQEIVGTSWTKLILKEDLERLQAYNQKRLINPADAPDKYEFSYYKKTGEIRNGLMSVTTIPYSGKFISSYIDITERKKAEEELVQSDERYRALFDRSLDIIYIHDFDGNFIDCNQAGLDLFGYSREDIPKVNFRDILNESQVEIALNTIEEVIKTGSQKEFSEYDVRSKNGQIFTVETKVSLMFRDGKPFAIQGIARDITERKKSSEALKLSEENFRGIFESNSSSIVIFGQDSIITMANDIFCENVGYSKQEVIGSRWTKFVHPRDLERLKEYNIKRFLNPNDAPSKYEFSFIKKDGEIRDALVSISILPDNSKIIASLIDITEMKKAEVALLESELKYRTLVEGINEGILHADLNEKVLFVNDQLCKMIGYSKKELLDKITYDMLLREEDRNMIQEKNIRRAQGLNDKYEIQLKHKSGRLVWTEISASPAYDIKNNIIGSIAVITDITDKKYAEINLRKLSRAVEQSFASVVITDVNGNIEYVNPHFSDVTGYSINEVLGKNPRFLKSGNTELEVYKKLWDTISSGNEWRGELLNKKKNGGLYWENISISPVKNIVGEITNYLAIFEDVTEKKFKDEQIKDSLKEKEVMLKEIHHRVKNNLQIISSLLKLQSSYIKDPQVLEYFQVSQSRIRSMALIHQQLYHSQSLSKINFQEYLKSLAKELISYNVSNKYILINVNVNELFFNIETSIPCGLIVNELISNSLKHAFNGRSEGKIDVDLFNVEKNKYKLIVKDDGVGLPESFDLNKPNSLGTELIISLVEQLDGSIEMENHNGTECRITFSELNYSKRI